MDDTSIEDNTFDKIDFTEQPLAKGTYTYCTFKQCTFSNTDLSDIKFIDCTFTGCDISLAKLVHTTFRDVEFKDCKLMGLHFENANAFGFTVSFDTCTLDHSSFYKKRLKKTSFKNTRLHEVDFTEADLTSAVFDTCDLTDARFDNTLLEKADLRTAYNYSINPEINKIKKARFSLNGIAGLLHKYDIEITV